MDNFSIFEYVDGKSIIHKMDPRLKMILVFLSMVYVFLIPSLIGILIALGIYIFLILITRIPFLKVINSIKPVIILSLFSFVLQLVYTTSNELLYTINFHFSFYNLLIMLGLFFFYYFTSKYIRFKITYLLITIIGIISIMLINFKSSILFNISFNMNIYKDGLNNGLFVFLRLILMVGIAQLLTLTTSTLQINSGVSSLLYPFKFIKIPVDVISMIFSLSLRFIPLVFKETKKIMKAQASRGVTFNEGSFRKKVTQIVSLIIPLFVICLAKGDDLSNAMEARGYVVGAKRTRYDILKFKYYDYIALIIYIGLGSYLVYLNVV